MTRKKSFVLYTDHSEQFSMLSDAQAGQLIKALMRLARDGTMTAFDDPMLKMAFSFISAQMRRDAEKYEEVCRKRAESGKKGASAKNANKQNKQMQANATDTDTVTDTDTETVTDTVSVSVSVNETEQETAASPVSPADAGTHTTHTKQKQKKSDKSVPTCEEVLALARENGYCWTKEEAVQFLAYNRDRGRTHGWAYAVTQWERNRRNRSAPSPADAPLSVQETDEMNDYLSLVNRFAG